MKLYATVTSERASKGQGGNDKLEIHLTINDEKRETLADITVLPSGTVVIDEGQDCYLVVNKYEGKGECNDCTEGVTSYPETEDGKCSWCGRKKEKGERQKGETLGGSCNAGDGDCHCQDCKPRE